MTIDISFARAIFLNCVGNDETFEATIARKEANKICEEKFETIEYAKDAIVSLRHYFLDSGINPPDEEPIFREIDRIAQATFSKQSTAQKTLPVRKITSTAECQIAFLLIWCIFAAHAHRQPITLGATKRA